MGSLISTMGCFSTNDQPDDDASSPPKAAASPAGAEIAAPTIVNGVNMDQFTGTVGAVQGNADVAKFQFRAKNTWISGGHSRTEVQGFTGACVEDASRKEPLVLLGDEPAVLLGGDKGANAVEAMLHAITSCLTVGISYNAAARGIIIESLEMESKGDLDLHNFLGLSEDVRPGYTNVEVAVKIKADADQTKLDELLAHVMKTSPVLDIMSGSVPVTFNVNAESGSKEIGLAGVGPNGVNMEQFTGTVGAVQGNADVAKFQFRANAKWISGGACRTEVQGFTGACVEDDSSKEPLVMEGDEPAVLLGGNKGCNAVEAVLHGMASCLAVGVSYNAAARGIIIESLDFDLKGDLDLHNFLGLSEDVRAGYTNIEVAVNLKANAEKGKLDELIAHVLKTSPVCAMIQNSCPVTVAFAK